MNRTTRAILLLGVFFAGCATSEVVARNWVPPARAGTRPQRWEYACQRATEDITRQANEFGDQGWEMVAAAGAGWGNALDSNHTMVWCFKRPLP
jgi:hypothetical protein